MVLRVSEGVPFVCSYNYLLDMIFYDLNKALFKIHTRSSTKELTKIIRQILRNYSGTWYVRVEAGFLYQCM